MATRPAPRRLNDSPTLNAMRALGLTPQSLVAGARGGSRVALAPGASGTGAERLNYAMTAGPGSWIEEMSPRTIARGFQGLSRNTTDTNDPRILDYARPMLSMISAYAGNLEDEATRAGQAGVALSNKPGRKAGQVMMSSGERAAQQREKEYQTFMDMYRDRWRIS